MNELEQRVREAFDEVLLPPEVRARTLTAIDDLAKTGEASPPKPRASRIVKWRRATIALAACLALAAVGLVGSRLYFEETAFVGIEVNPSIELGINRFDIVVSATAFNEDGQKLLDAVSLAGKRYDDAISSLTASAAFAPYLQDNPYIEISVTADDSRQSNDLRTQSDSCLDKLPCEGSCHAVEEGQRASAAAAGMGVGRYAAALRLLELDDSLTLEDCAAMSMRELRDRIAELGGDTGEDGSCNQSGEEAKSEHGHQGQGKGASQGHKGRRADAF